MRILKYATFVLAAGLVLTSCKKQLELNPTDSFTDANAFRTLGDAQLGANEAYARFGARASKAYQSALVSDEATLGKDNAGQGALTYRFQYSADATTGGDVTNTYYSFYSAINQVNRVLAALPNVLITGPSEEARREVLKGQLLAIRAAAHFELLESYSKNYNATDPLGITYVEVSDILAKPARMSIGDAVTKIETDLNTAFSLSPAPTAGNFTDTVFNQLNINAYRARVALYKGDYPKAIEYSSAVIASGIRPLASGSNYTGIWTDANVNQEVLFRIRYSNSPAIGSLWTTTSGLIYVAPSEKLRTSYGAGDIRLATFIGGSTGAYYVNKFFASSRGGRIVDLKVSRISEMYLLRAEAYAKTGTPAALTSGTADVNLVRANRITGYVDESFATSADLLTAVLNERFKELCFEGFRFWDLKRNNLPVSRLAADVQSTAWQTLAADNYRFVFPIPQSELLANPNSEQNDGYN
jgi:hypothetical protein